MWRINLGKRTSFPAAASSDYRQFVRDEPDHFERLAVYRRI